MQRIVHQDDHRSFDNELTLALRKGGEVINSGLTVAVMPNGTPVCYHWADIRERTDDPSNEWSGSR